MSAAAYSVSALTRHIRALLDADASLRDVWVEGEVSNLTRHGSGHWYFTLKDDRAALKCVMWRSEAARQTYIPDHGDAVLAHGRIDVYETGGQYQLYTDLLRPAGRGDLHARFEALKAKLEAEGLFAPASKRPLPAFPRRIGVVTSPTAAAFQDMQNVLRRRYPLAEVILSPTAVQGDDAPPRIVAALDALNRYGDVDVILLIRGGGSLEDLWCFNDERVARAVAASAIPVVCGVGHETDFTIADFAADVRAPTPSAAAEIATPDVAELAYTVEDLGGRLALVMRERLAEGYRRVEAEVRALRRLSPLNRVRNSRQRVDDLLVRAARSLSHVVELRRERLEARRQALIAADPRAILARGYAIVERAGDGLRLTSAADAAPGTALNVRLHKGRLRVSVKERDIS